MSAARSLFCREKKALNLCTCHLNACQKNPVTVSRRLWLCTDRNKILHRHYGTVPGKRPKSCIVMNFCLGDFSTTTPNNKSRDKTFVFVSEVSPTLCLDTR